VESSVGVGDLNLRFAAGVITEVEHHNKKAHPSAYHSDGLFASEYVFTQAALACSLIHFDISSS
jgi:hypothetical protein